jgi:transcription antitermination factor NusG
MDNEAWFALATSYCRELSLKKYFDEKSIKCFVPMKFEYIEKDGKRSRKWGPAIHNLIFVRSTRQFLQSIKVSLEGGKCAFRWVIDSATAQPIIIPDREMENFIRVCETKDEGLQFFDRLDEQHFKKGDYVRVIAGPFKGVEGNLVRIKKNRCVFVAMKGVAAVATTFVHPSMLYKIETENKE